MYASLYDDWTITALPTNIITDLASFYKRPRIKVLNGKALIHFTLNGSTTRIKVENCVRHTEICTTEDVHVPHVKHSNVNGTPSNYFEFVGKVILADPKAESFEFAFWIYDHDTLVSLHPVRVDYVEISRKLN